MTMHYVHKPNGIRPLGCTRCKDNDPRDLQVYENNRLKQNSIV